jgi:hypothetical protein
VRKVSGVSPSGFVLISARTAGAEVSDLLVGGCEERNEEVAHEVLPRDVSALVGTLRRCGIA